MTSLEFMAVLCTVLTVFAGAAAPQDADDDGDAASSDIERCFSVPSVVDVNVLTDRHIYVGTRGRNHYLLSMNECANLLRSYNRREVRLVPYGRTVCQNDGSHFLYRAGGRESPCEILTIDRVEGRAEARSLAEDVNVPVEVEEVPLDD